MIKPDDGSYGLEVFHRWHTGARKWFVKQDRESLIALAQRLEHVAKHEPDAAERILYLLALGGFLAASMEVSVTTEDD